MHALFSKYTVNINGTARGDDEPVDDEELDTSFFDMERGGPAARAETEGWTNSVLILVSNRLGLNKLQNEYFNAIKMFFHVRFNCGIIGGRPKEAFYLVGYQEDNLILLDPHNCLQTLDLDESTLK